MKTLTIREAREGLSHPETLFADADEVVVTRHGEPVARLLPVKEAVAVTRPKTRSMKWLRDQMPMQAVGSEVLIREDRNAR